MGYQSVNGRSIPNITLERTEYANGQLISARKNLYIKGIGLSEFNGTPLVSYEAKKIEVAPVIEPKPDPKPEPKPTTPAQPVQENVAGSLDVWMVLGLMVIGFRRKKLAGGNFLNLTLRLKPYTLPIKGAQLRPFLFYRSLYAQEFELVR